MATLWFAGGQVLPASRRETLLEAARARCEAAGTTTAGSTAPDEAVVVLRVLAQRVEPVFELLRQVRADWRRIAWALDAHPPRIWKS